MRIALPKLHAGVAAGLIAAALFGASTPFAKQLLGEVSPLLVAGLLYAGSGIGLTLWRLLLGMRGHGDGDASITRGDWPWLIGAVLFGGVIGPASLMLGLRHTSAAEASLLLNLESVLTAAIAWLVFRENVDRKVFLGMLVIVVGGVLLAWSPEGNTNVSLGVLGIVAACLCWAIDNNLTRVVSGGDPLQITALKGLVAGTVNIGLALGFGASLPAWPVLLAAGAIGVVGYGISLVLFIRALRDLGTARTGAYFSTAPFVGASLSLLMFGETPNWAFWVAGGLMAVGVWLHVSERHEHEHTHETLEHDHRHVHDEHHQHAHDFDWDDQEPHAHPHRHEPTTHSHLHYPDLHHRHRH